MKRKHESDPKDTIQLETDEDLSSESSSCESDKSFTEETTVYVCEICESLFDSNQQLNLHMETHSEYVPSEESDGDDSDDFKSDESETEKEPPKGDKCSRCRHHFVNLEKHMETVHTPYKCTKCDKVFDDRPKMKAHQLRVHSRRTRYTCEVCKKSYTTKYHLQAHKEAKHEKKVYVCEQCGKVFSGVINLRIHKRKHLEKDDRDIVCDVCGKRIAYRNKSRHIRIHAKNKAFKCAVCDRCFNEKDQLDKHSRTHTGEKPYKCETCPKAFSHNVSLKGHIKKCHS